MHIRMDIAEDVGDAFAIEFYAARLARLIKRQIKALAIKERKDVVEERVFVGKLHTAANRNHKQTGDELLVLLYQLPLQTFWSGKAFSNLFRLEPDDHIRVIWLASFHADRRVWPFVRSRIEREEPSSTTTEDVCQQS